MSASHEIAIRGLSKSFGPTVVLSDVDLAIDRGEFVVVLGASGCGKSTLLRLIAGLEAPTSGTIAIAGRNVNGLEPRERGCAMVFQNYALYPHMSVADNIGYALRVARVAKRERLERVARVAAIVGLDGLLERKPAQLSGGQRQRVAMARAIIREPKVFLFDEPLSNLDAKLRVAMRQEVKRIHERTGATSLFVTHDQLEAMTLADRLVVMHEGRIEQVGAPAKVYDQPQNVAVAAFLGTPQMNLIAARLEASSRRLVLADGSAIATSPKGLADGASVTVGLRPEDIRLVPQGDGALAARFEFSEELGAGRIHHLCLAGHQVVVASTERQDFAKGDGVGLAFERMHLFDAADGRRIPADPS